MGEGIHELGFVKEIEGNKAPKVKIGQEIIKIDKRYFRPSEVETLLGDPTKAIKELGWKTNISAKKMCEEMINEDYKAAKRITVLKEYGLDLPTPLEQ